MFLRGYEGPRCETDADECRSGPCQNQGRSVTVRGDFLAHAVSKTSMSAHQTRATAMPFAKTSFECVCPGGYFGALCDLDVDECVASPCLHEGICINTPGGFQCVCLPGYSVAPGRHRDQ
ncbi:hypothetical protein CRUP_016446 [Coryphaenoides rupestris]|nr:hypothetical protein CRUP_016446 [Coryphaenoides rupestris]